VSPSRCAKVSYSSDRTVVRPRAQAVGLVVTA